LEAKSTNRESRDGGQTPLEALRLKINEVLCPFFLYQRKTLIYKKIITNYS